MRLTARNKFDESITFRPHGDFIARRLGMSHSIRPVNTFIGTPYQDGAKLYNNRTGIRELELEFTIIGDVDARREELIRVFNPVNNVSTLTYIKPDHAPVQIDFILAEPIRYSRHGPNMLDGVAVLACPDPYWRSTEVFDLEVIAYNGLLEFPLEFNAVEFGAETENFEIDNEGHIPAPAIIRIYGYIENPVITNVTTGEHIELDFTIPTGHWVEINTAFGNKYVRYYEDADTYTDIFNTISLESTFWQLQAGINEISYEYDDALPDATVFIQYKRRYIGI